MLFQVNSVLMFIIVVSQTTMAARILAVFPFPSYSHTVTFHTLTEALAERNHELTVFTVNPMNKNMSNYHEISLNFLYKYFSNQFNIIETTKEGLWPLLRHIYKISSTLSGSVFSHPEMQKLMQSTKPTDKFDLILVGAIYLDSLYYLADVFNAPLISMISIPEATVVAHIMGQPNYNSYIPNSMAKYTNDMTFFQRINNIYVNLRVLYEYYAISLPIQEQVLKKYFGNNVPPIRELSQRISMYFVNSHPYLSYVRPKVPGILEIGGLRFTKMNKTLPMELKKLLDNCTRGFIYFSLGTNAKSIHLSNETLSILIKVFSELPYQIIWKFESEYLMTKSDNVYISKWMPQQGILAHPNIKLFVYQGGLQSTEEAIDNGVPVLGFPIFGDQQYNLNILSKHGVAKFLNIRNTDKYEIMKSIEEMTSNSSYRDNMIKLRELLYDRPQHPLKEAIWWVEHVIRHKGARHLHTRSRDLSWYTIELVDVYGFFVVLLIVLFLLGRTLLRWTIAMIKVQCSSYFDKVNGPSTMKKFKSS